MCCFPETTSRPESRKRAEMSVNLMSSIFEVEFFDLKDENGNTTKASTAKLVLLAMADHANDEGEGAYPSVERLCRKTALSEQTIRNTFDALRYNGIIFLEGKSKYGTNNHTINTKSFPRAKEKEVKYLTLYPLDPPTSTETPITNNVKTLPVIPESSLSIQKTSPDNKPDFVDAILEQARKAEVIINCLNDFESSMGFTSLPWESNNSWSSFSKWIVKIMQIDPLVWKKYSAWRKENGKYDAMSNKQIRMNPKMFMDTDYPTFCASYEMYGLDGKGGGKPKTHTEPQRDEKGFIISW
jgi:hypothetical protein